MIKDKQFFCSWSGGKDSCLALYKALEEGGKPVYLLNMMAEVGLRSRSHGLSFSVIEKQSEMLEIPLIAKSASWNEYEKEFVEITRQFKEKGVEVGVFGDIDLQPHLDWINKICVKVNITPFLPLWKRNRRELVEEFINLGFKAKIVSIKEEKMDKKYLGMNLSIDLIGEFESIGVDPAGEEGEFHTVVTDGPIFSAPIVLYHGDQSFHDGYWFLDVNI